MRLDRIEEHEEVLIDVIECIRRPELRATSMSGSTEDVSEGGVKMSSGMSLPVATRVGLRIGVASTLYRLEGEVRWAMKEGKHYLGVMLDETSQDFAAWSKRFQLDF